VILKVYLLSWQVICHWVKGVFNARVTSSVGWFFLFKKTSNFGFDTSIFLVGYLDVGQKLGFSNF